MVGMCVCGLLKLNIEREREREREISKLSSG